MAILNYTTDVPVEKTVGEIQKILIKARASRVTVDYRNQVPSAMLFELNGESYLLPCRVEAVHKILQQDSRLKPSQRSFAQAERVAWRILFTWIKAQIAIIETGMVELDEVMLPYALVRPGRSVYQVYRQERADRLLEKKP